MDKLIALLEDPEIDQAFIFDCHQNTCRHYQRFTIAKRTGGARHISAPTAPLLSFQRRLLKEVLYSLPANAAAKAYQPHKNVRENARFHKGQALLLKADIVNFFGSISKSMIVDTLTKKGLDPDSADFIAAISCLDGVLPQGAPTSGHLSNLVMDDFDRKAIRFAIWKGLRYTRYSDDITFSGPSLDKAEVCKFLRRALSGLGFQLNPDKLRLLKNGTHRQTVTGIVVNAELSPGRTYLRAIRQEVHFIMKFGIRTHARHRRYASESQCLSALLGKIAYALSICKDKAQLLDWQSFLLTMNKDYAGRPALPET